VVEDQRGVEEDKGCSIVDPQRDPLPAISSEPGSAEHVETTEGYTTTGDPGNRMNEEISIDTHVTPEKTLHLNVSQSVTALSCDQPCQTGLNGDGKLDIGVGTWKHCPLDEGYVHFFTLDAPYDPDLIEWGNIVMTSSTPGFMLNLSRGVAYVCESSLPACIRSPSYHTPATSVRQSGQAPPSRSFLSTAKPLLSIRSLSQLQQ